MLQHLQIAYFSPTGGTKRAALCLGRALAAQAHEIDLSLPGDAARAFGPDDLVLFAAPVYGGRIPAYILEKLRACQGNGAAAIAAAVYGNRAYDDALLELSDTLKARGFRMLAAATLVAEHSIVRALASGRPDERDCLDYRDFAGKIAAKLSGAPFSAEPNIPGKRPYVQWTAPPVTPAATDACARCGLCAAKCPTGAIARENLQTADPAKCLRCMRCVSICPRQARTMPPAALAASDAKLAPFKNVRRANELFL